jgi:hypothetical protein
MLNESLKKRIQKLAGIQLNEQFDGGAVDTLGLPKNEIETLAYNIEQYKKIMGSDSIIQIVEHLKQKLKQPFIVEKENAEFVYFSQPRGYFLKFKGYLTDSESYFFSIGHKNNLGLEIFDYEISVDMNKNIYNLKSLKL